MRRFIAVIMLAAAGAYGQSAWDPGTAEGIGEALTQAIGDARYVQGSTNDYYTRTVTDARYLLVDGEGAVSNLIVSGSITLGGNAQTVWPTGNLATVDYVSTNLVALYSGISNRYTKDESDARYLQTNISRLTLDNMTVNRYLTLGGLSRTNWPDTVTYTGAWDEVDGYDPVTGMTVPYVTPVYNDPNILDSPLTLFDYYTLTYNATGLPMGVDYTLGPYDIMSAMYTMDDGAHLRAGNVIITNLLSAPAATFSGEVTVSDGLAAGNTTINGTLEVSDAATFAADTITPRTYDGDFNAVSGYGAMQFATESDDNAVSGRGAMYQAAFSDRNGAIGYEAMYAASNCSYNAVIGFKAMYQAVSSVANGAFGYLAMYQASSTSNSLAVGAFAGRNATGTARGYIDSYATDPGAGHNPTNDLIFFDNGDLYLGRGGTTGKKIVLRNLPTSDPGEAGQLWQDTNGFMRVSQ
ncbi:MAG: hypothetical protein EOM20_03320 [Spartobacteria bacterium]|nr:hypothetical protein [Spartobacteria bacterium]